LGNVGKLDGKVAIVTGAAQGMGEAHARRLALEGAIVVLSDVNEALGKAVADDIGDSAVFAVHDVTSLRRDVVAPVAPDRHHG
jgi:3alpha(or 20beta)-hydroxysteroid dehydrogenase